MIEISDIQNSFTLLFGEMIVGCRWDRNLSKDGNTATAFHEKCDKKGANSEQIIGGYNGIQGMIVLYSHLKISRSGLL
jgi:hypothetical protein